MLRKLLLPAVLTGLLAGCVTDYGYRDGYYYGQPRVEYRYHDEYGYPGYGYYPYGGRYYYAYPYYSYPYYSYPYYRYPYYYQPYRSHDRDHHGDRDHDRRYPYYRHDQQRPPATQYPRPRTGTQEPRRDHDDPARRWRDRDGQAGHHDRPGSSAPPVRAEGPVATPRTRPVDRNGSRVGQTRRSSEPPRKKSDRADSHDP